MNTDSSPFLLYVMAICGTISIWPSAYGRSSCCCGVSGAGSGSIRSATSTVLVLSSPFQKSGTFTDCLTTDVFGTNGGAPFGGGVIGVASLATTYTSYAPVGTVKDRAIRIGPLCPGVGVT